MSESTISVDDLFVNLANQHAETYEKYLAAKAQTEKFNAKPQQQGNATFDLREVQSLRDQCVKLEGALDGLNLYFTECLGEEPREYVKEVDKAPPKVRLPNNRKEDYGDLENWTPDEDAPKVDTGV